MSRRLFATAAVVSLVFVGVASAQAGALTTRSPLVASLGQPAAKSPRIGYVYAAGGVSGVGITAYAQQANGALTSLHQVTTDGADQDVVLVHLKSGVALYDLTKDELLAYHVNAVTGALTQFKIPQPTSPVSSAFGLGAYDPLAHGLAGQPMLLTGSCGDGKTPAASDDCFYRLQWFLVNPKTGALSKSKVGPTSGYNIGITKMVGDGMGRFAIGLYDSDGHAVVAMYRAKVVAGQTAPYGVAARLVTDTDMNGVSHDLTMGSTIVITSAGAVDFPAGPLYGYSLDGSDRPGGWLAYAFGSLKGPPESARIDSSEATASHEGLIQATASTQGRKWVFVGEQDDSSVDLPAGMCAIEGFGPLNPGSGLSHARTLLPCSGSDYNFVNSLYAQGGFVYAGMYPGGIYGFIDDGTPYLSPTAQKSLPDGGQIYSWAGFLFGKPTVNVPPVLSLKQGIKMSITCPQACSGSASAKVKIAGSSTVHAVASRVFKTQPPGVFGLTLPLSSSLHKTIAAAIKKHFKVTVTTKVKVVSAGDVVNVTKVSQMHA
jgi:hypothetical protein